MWSLLGHDSMTRSLITGGAGFIGYHLAKTLADREQDITIVDNLSRGKIDQEFLELTDRKNVTFIKADLTKRHATARLENTYDHVYHLAAINGTRYFYERPVDVLTVNVFSTANILAWIADKEKKAKIVFASSSETYSGTPHIPYPTPEAMPLTIIDPTNPRWSYAGSKIYGELLMQAYAKTKNVRTSTIRYTNIYGSRTDKEHVIPRFIIDTLQHKDPFPINGWRPTRTFCYVQDACDATIAIMETNKTDGKTINVGNSKEEVTMYDLATRIFRIAKWWPKTIRKLPHPTGSTMRRCPDTRLLKELTNYEAKTDLQTGLAIAYAWFKDHPEYWQ